jgi:hypothetical protein
MQCQARWFVVWCGVVWWGAAWCGDAGLGLSFGRGGQTGVLSLHLSSGSISKPFHFHSPKTWLWTTARESIPG